MPAHNQHRITSRNLTTLKHWGRKQNDVDMDEDTTRDWFGIDNKKKPLSCDSGFDLEARAGVEPTYTDLQSGA